MNTTPKIGITGCRGFVGQHLCDLLQKENIPYVCFAGDLLKHEDVIQFFTTNKIEQIVHLVGTFDPPFDNLITKNVLTTQNLLDIGSKNGLKKIIYASTGAVYGEPLQNFSFEHDHLNPNTLYGLSKMYAEKCITYYHENENISYVILRFSSIYGDGNKKGVIYKFLDAAKNGREIEIEDDGTQSRNFLHVNDACDAIIESLSYTESDIFNVSYSKKITINFLAKILETKYPLKKIYKKSNNNLKDLLLNCDKSKKKLKFNPKYKIEDYLLGNLR